MKDKPLQGRPPDKIRVKMKWDDLLQLLVDTPNPNIPKEDVEEGKI